MHYQLLQLGRDMVAAAADLNFDQCKLHPCAPPCPWVPFSAKPRCPGALPNHPIAGAINATYFLTGQPEGLDIYTRELAQGERFLNLRRYWSSDPVMDVGYLLDDVMNQVG